MTSVKDVHLSAVSTLAIACWAYADRKLISQRIQPVPSNPNPYPAQGGYNAPPMAQPSYGGGPPQPPTQGYRPPGPPQMQNGPGPGGYGGPSPMQQVPPPASGFDALPPHAQAALAGLPDEQKVRDTLLARRSFANDFGYVHELISRRWLFRFYLLHPTRFRDWMRRKGNRSSSL